MSLSETVLIINGNAGSRRLAASSLSAQGHSVLEAETGTEGEQLATKHHPDLVFLSWNLTGYEGGAPTLCRAIKTGASSRSFIVYLGAPAEVEQQPGYSADGVIGWPIPMVEFEAWTRAMLRIARSQRTERMRQSLCRRYFETAREGILILDAQTGVIESANPYLLKMLDLQRGDIEGRILWQIDVFRPVASSAAILESWRRQEGVPSENFGLVLRGGSTLPVEWTVLFCELDGAEKFQCHVRDVSLERRLETLLHERSLFMSLMECMPDTIYFKDRQSRFLQVNQAFLQHLRLKSPEEVLGKTDFDIFGSEHARQAFDSEQAIMESGKPMVAIEEKEDHRDGEVSWVSSTKVPIHDMRGQITGLVGISRNITRRKQMEAALRSSLSKYRNLIESVSDWVWETDVRGRCLYSSPRVQDILGYEAFWLVGRPISDVMLAAENSRVMNMFEMAKQEGKHQITFDCLCLHEKGGTVMLEMNVRAMVDDEGRIQGFRGVGRDVTERRRFEEDLRKFSRAVEQSPVSVVITNTHGAIEYVNACFCRVTGYSVEEVLGKNPRILKSNVTPPGIYKDLWTTVFSGREWRGELCNKKKNGDLFWESVAVSAIKNDEGEITHFLGVKEDITERKKVEKERSLMEMQLLHAQKLESVGQLAAGIAHEINTPIQYVGDNLRFIQESFQQLFRLFKEYEKLLTAAREGVLTPEMAKVADEAIRKADFAYLSLEVPTALEQSLDGVQRVANIVRAMKEFSHPGAKEKTPVDLNHAIQTTVTVARNEWKYVADVEYDLAPNMPMVQCLPDEFNQVVLNLLVNAAQAIGEIVKKTGGKGLIRISTRSDDTWAEVRISDTGGGIPAEIQHRIFEPFFTTKEVGKGTGQGLAIARASVINKHGGEIQFESTPGQGSTFIVRLPITAPTGLKKSA